MKTVRYGLIGFGAHAEQCYAEFILKQKLVKNATIAADKAGEIIRKFLSIE